MRSKRAALASALRLALLAGALALAAVACSPRDGPSRNAHETMAPASDGTLAVDARDLARRARAIPRAPTLDSRASDADVWAQAAENADALDRERIETVEVARSPESQARLARLNDALLELTRRRSAALARPLPAAAGRPPAPLLEAYARALFDGCDVDGRACRHLGYFRQDPRGSSRVALALSLATVGDVRERYRRLFVAYATKSAIADPDLDEAYLSGYRELTQELEARPRPEDRVLFEANQRTISLIFETRAPAMRDGPWLDALNPWSATRIGFNRFGTVAFEILAFANANGLRGADGQLRPAAARAAAAVATDADGFFARARKVEPAVRAQLGIEDIGAADEYVLIADRVFRGDWTPADGLDAWNASGRDRVRFARVLRAYVQVEFALAMRESHEFMGAFFRDRIQNIVNEDAFRRMINRGLEFSPRWKEGFLRGANNLRQVAGLALVGPGRLLADGDALARDAGGFFSSLHRNVKIAVVYPQMIALAYKMGVFDLRLQFQIWWMQIVIHPEKIMGWIFRGQVQPWFDFSDDRAPARPDEIFHAYHFLLASGGLAAWGIEPAPLFDMVARKLVGASIDDLRQRSRDLANNYAGADWREIERICAGLRDGQPYPFTRTVGDLRDGGFFGQAWTSMQRGVGDLATRFRTEGSVDVTVRERAYNPHSAWTNATGEMIRLELDPTLGKLRELTEIHRAVLRGSGMSDDAVDGALSPMAARLADYQDARDQWIREYHKARARWDGCYFVIKRQSDRVDLDLMQAEELHLRDVHADILRLRANPSLQAEIDRKHAYRVGNGYRGTSKISPIGYYMTPIDFKIRVSRYLQDGIATARGAMAPVDPNVHVLIPPNVLDSLDVTENNVALNVDFVDDEDAFVDAALRAISSEASSFHIWFETTRLAALEWNHWQMGVALYYRLGPVGGASPSETTIDEAISRPLELLRATSMSERRRALQRRLGKPVTVSANSLNDIMIDRTTREALPALDNVYAWATSEYLGAVGSGMRFPAEGSAQPTPEMEPILATARNYATARAQQGPYAFRFPAEIDAGLAAYHRARVGADLRRRQELEQAILAREASDLAAGLAPVISYHVDQTFQPRYLSPALRSSERRTITEFHERETTHCFDPDPAQAAACPW